MSTNVLNVKKLSSHAIFPTRAFETDAGLDLYVDSMEVNDAATQITYGCGHAIEIPKDYVGLLFPRSSVCKYDLALANSVGVIDSGYNGEVKGIFNILNAKEPQFYQYGDRFAQLVIVPIITPTPVLVESLDTTARGSGGFGHTGIGKELL